jgi:hypothetical protein
MMAAVATALLVGLIACHNRRRAFLGTPPKSTLIRPLKLEENAVRVRGPHHEA